MSSTKVRMKRVTKLMLKLMVNFYLFNSHPEKNVALKRIERNVVISNVRKKVDYIKKF